MTIIGITARMQKPITPTLNNVLVDGLEFYQHHLTHTEQRE